MTTQMHHTHFPGTSATCVACGGQYEQARRWQRFCSIDCRVRYHKEKTGLRARIERLEARVAKLEGKAR